MADGGYVYILLNPTMNGLLKIGKTTRDPSTRVAELSSATGVPSPFLLAYQIHTVNCDLLERIVHTQLASDRYTENREFFTTPLHKAIQILVQAESMLKPEEGEESSIDENLKLESTPLWVSLQKEADNS